MARLDEFDYSIVEAARDLGANEFQTLLKVILPSMMPGIVSAFLMAMTLSLDDFVITSFVTGTNSNTLPASSVHHKIYEAGWICWYLHI